MTHHNATADGAIQLEPGYTIKRIVAGSGLHTANGIAFGPDGRLYVASVPGESIFALDTATGVVTAEVAPFSGEADDLVFTPEGDLIWTAFMEGAVRRRDPDGGLRDPRHRPARHQRDRPDPRRRPTVREPGVHGRGGCGRSTSPGSRRRGSWPTIPAG